MSQTHMSLRVKEATFKKTWTYRRAFEFQEDRKTDWDEFITMLLERSGIKI